MASTGSTTAPNNGRFDDSMTPDDVWNALRSSALPITLESLAPMLVEASSGFTASALPPQRTKTQEPRFDAKKGVDTFLDSFGLHTRIDAVEESSLTPFSPLIHSLNSVEFEALKYGILVNSHYKTLLVHHPFKSPLHDFGALENLPRAKLPAEIDAEIAAARRNDKDDPERVMKEAQARGAAAAAAMIQKQSAIIQADHWFFLMRISQVAVPDPYAVPKNADDTPMTMKTSVIPLFALLFRNTGKDDRMEAFYELSAVYISGHRYWGIHADLREQLAKMGPQVDYYDRLNADNCDAIRLREEAWAAWEILTHESLVSSPPRSRPASAALMTPMKAKKPSNGSAAEEKKHEAAVSNQIARGALIIPADEVEASGELTVVSHSAMKMVPVNASTTSSMNGSKKSTTAVAPLRDFLPRVCTYGIDRMKNRIVIVDRRGKTPQAKSLRVKWNEYCTELGLNPATECAWVVLRDTRNGINSFEEGELTAFLPRDADVNRLEVYSTAAEEQLRLWIQNALTTAHQKNIHQVFLRIDIPWLLGRCAEICISSSVTCEDGIYVYHHEPALDILTSQDEDAAAASAAAAAARNNSSKLGTAPRRRCVSICVRTIEEYVRKSGVVWRVIICPMEDGEGEELEMVQAELTSVQREVLANEVKSGVIPPQMASTPLKHTPQPPGQTSTAMSPVDSSNGGSSRPKTRRGLSLPGGLGTASALEASGYITCSPSMHVAQQQDSNPDVTGTSSAQDPIPPTESRPVSGSQRGLTPSPPVSHTPTKSALKSTPSGHKSVSVVATEPVPLVSTTMAAVAVPSPCALDDNIIVDACLSGKPITEYHLMSLFRRLDVDNSGYLSVQELRKVLLNDYDSKYAAATAPKTARGTTLSPARPLSGAAAKKATGNVLIPLDNCGLPWGDADVEKFVAKFTNPRSPGKMSFDEFSLMMLHIAQR